MDTEHRLYIICILRITIHHIVQYSCTGILLDRYMLNETQMLYYCTKCVRSLIALPRPCKFLSLKLVTQI